MKVSSYFFKTISLVILTSFSFMSFAQNQNYEEIKNSDKNSFFFNYRGANVIEAAIGTSSINGDLPDAMFEIAFRIGYKRSLSPYFDIGLTYNKFNLAFKDIYNEGFMSFDVNLEYLLSPYKNFSPFIFAGGGLNASNYFTQTATKFQGGAGFEIIVAPGMGLRLLADYNYVLSDTLDGRVFGASDDTYWRILGGVTIYFGGGDKKDGILKGLPSIMNSNPIIKEN
ncbi:Curli production assembly/transport component CsgG [Gelidibacter sp.]|uniref:Curli production assembly/transport component CsgG n=1 Tax=Gelidibacter sp. TaxID=2018083 RepID=UPI002C6F4E30|nr:Curli production assembly/transport component CsgG [Gelidibacter sp.]HUH27759.1 hypothetical protein [Gelidibacter sp.]